MSQVAFEKSAGYEPINREETAVGNCPVKVKVLRILYVF